jgi:hypothetical protein
LRPPWATRSVSGIPGVPEALGVPETPWVPEVLGVPEALGVPEGLGVPGVPGPVLVLEADLGLRVSWPGSVKGPSGDLTHLAKDLPK